MPAPHWLIDGMFEVNALVMLAGPSYSFKSFLLLDWLLSVASGRKWNGKKTLLQKVAYVLGEGKASLIKRINAWVTYNDLTPAELALLKENFRVTFDVPQIAVKSSVDNFLADIQKEGFKPDVIAIDTFARSFVGLDENDAKDTGLWVDGADRLRQLGYTVIFLHHTKKNSEFGHTYRGSTAIIGAMDTAFTLVREGQYANLKCDKQKDHDEGAPMRFRRLLVGRGEDESCVLTFAPTLDDRYAGNEVEPRADDIDRLIDGFLANPIFKSDRERGLELARVTGMNDNTAISAVYRRKRRNAPGESEIPEVVENQELNPEMH